MSTGVAEGVSPEEVRENNLFLDAVLQTAVMKVNNLSAPVQVSSRSIRPVLTCSSGLTIALSGNVTTFTLKLGLKVKVSLSYSPYDTIKLVALLLLPMPLLFCAMLCREKQCSLFETAVYMCSAGMCSWLEVGLSVENESVSIVRYTLTDIS